MEFKNEFLLDLEEMENRPKTEEYTKKHKAAELGIKMAEILGWKESEADPVRGVKKFTLHVVSVDAKAYYQAIKRIGSYLPEGHPVFDILNEMHELNNPQSTPSKT